MAGAKGEGGGWGESSPSPPDVAVSWSRRSLSRQVMDSPNASSRSVTRAPPASPGAEARTEAKQRSGPPALTATPGLPYTIECSPNRMSFPGAEQHTAPSPAIR